MTSQRFCASARVRAGTSLACVVVLASLAVPSSAGAHLRSGTVAVDYRASVVASSTPAYSVQIFQSESALGLTLKPGHVVVLVGPTLWPWLAGLAAPARRHMNT
jgi:hypothetical protein